MINTNIEPGQSTAKNPVACFRFSDNLLVELEDQFASGKTLEGIVIDLTECGFSISMHYAFAFTSYASKLLAPGGVMVMLSRNSGMVLEMDRDGLAPTLKCFRPADGIFAHWPFLTELVRTSVPSFDHLFDGASASSFRTYIIRSMIPVLTESGRQARQQAKGQSAIDFILQGVDDHRSISTINKVAQRERGLSEAETIKLLQSLETSKLIYPIFRRPEFLVDCYTNQKSFRLGRYFVAAGLMSKGELVALLERQEELLTGENKRVLLGRLAIEAGYLNERYLNMLLQEQYTFGGHKARATGQGEAPAAGQFGDSLFGSLGTIDPPGLLQSIASTQKPGLLSVESKRGVLLVSFDGGRLVGARLNRLLAKDAITEFVVSWDEGIFLFREDLALTDLTEGAAIKANLGRILLDAALLQDNVQTILKGFPHGLNTVFERVWNFESAWKALQAQELKLLDESILPQPDGQIVFEMAQMIDGLSTVDDVVLQNATWPSHKSMFALHLLLTNNLITVKDNVLFSLLRQLQTLSTGMAKIFGEKDNHHMLVASLQQAQERYPLAQSCQVREDSSISVEMGRLKAEGAPVSSILEALKYLMSTYIAFGRRLNKEMVDRLLDPAL